MGDMLTLIEKAEQAYDEQEAEEAATRILEGEFTVWWGKDASNLEDYYALNPGDCAYYPTGWKYHVKNTGDTPGKFFYYMSEPRSGKQRFGYDGEKSK